MYSDRYVVIQVFHKRLKEFTHREAANDVLLLVERLRIDHFSAMWMSTGGMTLQAISL